MDFIYEMEHFLPFFATVFMIPIISDYKSNIKYDFAVLESYFINNGEDIVPLLNVKSVTKCSLF